MTLKLAIFKCLKCNHEWVQMPAIVECPKCNHQYVKWVNYEQWRKENMTYPYT
jgi:rubrerythrin